MGNRRPRLASTKTCSGCMACVDSCRHGAISYYLGDDGHNYVRVNNDACIGCLSCEKVCPVVSDIVYNQSERAEFFAAWNTNKEERSKSASGGAFSAMAHYVIEQGGVVIGAAIENVCDVKHVVISDINDLQRLQGSKYTQSDTKGIYKVSLQYLKDGKTVLFSGTGCQIAGLLSFLDKRKFDGKLITVDLICGGVPSKFLINKFVENEPYKVKRILSFRTKENGWKPKGFEYNLKVEDTEGKVHDYTGKKNLITTGFSKELTNRYSCYNCRFVGKHRLSDFTIGDLWGDNVYPKEHNNGVSLVIAHNQHAIDLLKKMRDYLQLSSYDSETAIRSNYRLLDGKSVMGMLWERRFMNVLFRRCSYSMLRRIYANDYSKYSPWAFIKIQKKCSIALLHFLFK